MEEWELLSFTDINPISNIKTDKKWIPFIGFTFLWIKPENFEIKAICESGEQKKSTDWDNLKVITHNKLYHNPKSPTSDKYKNFYFSEAEYSLKDWYWNLIVFWNNIVDKAELAWIATNYEIVIKFEEIINLNEVY